MTVKQFANSTGMTLAKARKIAPTIPGADRDITRTVAGKHPWILPDNAPELYFHRASAEQSQQAQSQPEPPRPEQTPEKPEEQPKKQRDGGGPYLIFLLLLLLAQSLKKA